MSEFKITPEEGQVIFLALAVWSDTEDIYTKEGLNETAENLFQRLRRWDDLKKLLAKESD